MATKVTKKAKKTAQKPYSPTAVGYPTVGAFNKAVKTTAMAGLQPQINTVKQQQQQGLGAHKTRVGQIGGWARGQANDAKAASSSLNASTQALLNSMSGGNQGMNDAMSAAVRKINDTASANASQLGVAGQKVDPNVLLASGAYGQGGDLSMAGMLAGIQAHGAAMAPMATSEGAQNTAFENDRWTQENQGYKQQRSDLMGQLPGLMTSARSSLSAAELAKDQERLARSQFGEQKVNDKANRIATRAQTKLATKQFGLSAADLREKKRAAKVAERQQQVQLGINQQQVDVQKAQIIATADKEAGKANSDLAVARAKQFDKGITFIQNAWKMTPNDQVYAKDANGFQTKDIDPNATAKRIEGRMKGKFDEMVRQIQANTGLGPGYALRVMMAAPNSGWAKEAQKRLKSLKQARAKVPDSIPNPTSYHS
jgi:hypothetical protein